MTSYREDPETERLARELAQLAGLPVAAAVREAIEARLADLRRPSPTDAPGLDAIITRGRARPTVDPRTEAEILGYDSPTC